MRKIYNYIFVFIMMIILPMNVKAFSASISLTGPDSVQQGNKITLTLRLNSASNNLSQYGGQMTYSSNVSFDGCSGVGLSFRKGQQGMIAFSDGSGDGMGPGVIGTCTFTANGIGSANVKISNTEVVDVSASATVGNVSKNFNVVAPPSGDNNLSSLSVSNCSINFSAGNTNYSCNVDTNVTSVNVSASAAHGKASVSGTGNKNLNYGNNKISVTVRAENGSTKTYTINVNRKDTRSGDNSLSSLTCSNCSLSPGFSPNQTNYKTNVEYAVSQLNLKYSAKDSKAIVRVNNNNLAAEETTNVTIVVTAENGSTKTYTISASRGKDPNKVLSKDNNLVSLSIDQGILSPAFTSEQTNYAVYLPYEISKINIAYEISDKRYATAVYHGPDELGVGNNVFTIAVKAEDESEKVYTITVVRAKSLVGDASNNTLLASLSLKNGNLTEDFKSGTHLYYYNKDAKKEVVVSAIAQDKEAVITYLEAGAGVYAVLVTAPSGNSSVYIMIPEEKKSLLFIIIAAIIILLLTIIVVIIRVIKSRKNKDSKDNKHKDKKEKKNKKNTEDEEE